MPRRADHSKSNTGAWLLLAGILVVSVIAISSVLKVRMESGETYPYYSASRSDPLGTRALFEALDALPGVEAERNYMPLNRVTGAPGATMILAGMTAQAFNSPYWMDTKAVSHFALDGGRVVIALNPEGYDGRFDRVYRQAVRELEEEDKKRESKDSKKSKDGTDKKKVKPEKKAEPKTKQKVKREPGERSAREEKPSFAEVLHIAPKAKEWFTSRDGEGSALEWKGGAPLTAEDCPRWMSNVFLEDDPQQDWSASADELSRYIEKKMQGQTKDAPTPVSDASPSEASPWKVIASKGVRPMIMERKLGMGTVVVCTDRYFLSNEALWKDAKPAYLSWLIGDAKKVIFDETHLGSMIGDEEGIMTLARRHGMHGLFLGGILLFALFVWRSAISLVPPNPDDDLGHWRADAVEGRSTTSGLEGLLRRGIATKGLLQRCFEVWSGTRAAVSAVPADRLAKARKIVEENAGAKSAAAAYRAVRDALHPPR